MTHFDSSCPGTYCGRVILNGTAGVCGACPRGFRSNNYYICDICNEELKLYDWIYLFFMVLVYVIIQMYFIDKSIKSNKFYYISLILYLATICEVIVACILSVLPFTSDWSLKLSACGVKSFSDWYTLFYNPSLNDNFYCTHEAVYPLYSIVFIFYIILLGLVLVRHIYLRLFCAIVLMTTKINCFKKIYAKGYLTNNIYYILYSIPALMFTHAIFAGVIYYLYPYLTIVGSVISITIHFSLHLEQSPQFLIKATLHNCRNFTIVAFHWLMHTFGIVSLTELKHTSDYFLLFLVPFPTLFYIYTCKFTDPSSF